MVHDQSLAFTAQAGRTSSSSVRGGAVFQSPGCGGVYSVSYVRLAPAVIPDRAATGRSSALHCPDCGADLQRVEGCWLCRTCGYSPCA